MPKYLAELDGLRAISVVMVITAHMHQKVWHWASGDLGVVVFFALSGYLITSLALAEQQRTGRVDLRAFYIRRAFRIFPLYYFVLAAYCLLIFGIGVGPEKANGLRHALPYFLTYFQELPYFWGWSTPFFQTWSLGIEEKFYLVWPVLAFVFFPKSAKVVAVGLMTISVGCCFLGSTAMFYPYSAILVGCVLALSNYKFCGSPTPVVFGMLLLQIGVIPLVGGKTRMLLTFTYACLVVLLIRALVNRSTRLNRLLSWKPLAWVGKVSYGIYLVHLIFISPAERITSNPLVAYCFATIFSIAVASVLHIAIERPLIRLGRRIASPIVRRELAALPAPTIS